MPPVWVYDDGGRAAAGLKGHTRDCVTRAVAIATGLPYREVYDAINETATRERPRNGRSRSGARTGVAKSTTRRYLDSLGFTWHPTMQIGTGTRVHLRADELPGGTIIVQASKHVVAVLDGVVHDTHDPTRGGTRCVYGYWFKPTTEGDGMTASAEPAQASTEVLVPTIRLAGATREWLRWNTSWGDTASETEESKTARAKVLAAEPRRMGRGYQYRVDGLTLDEAESLEGILDSIAGAGESMASEERGDDVYNYRVIRKDADRIKGVLDVLFPPEAR